MTRLFEVLASVTTFCAIAVILLGTTTANGQDGELFLTNYINALNANMPPNSDSAAISKLFAEDGVHREPFSEPMEEPLRGREAIQDFYAGFDEIFADWTHVESSRMTQGYNAVWEGLAQGTHKETGKPLRLPIVFFIEFNEEGLVREARTYVDIHLIAGQLE